jgi:hypothetical protein
MVCIPAAHRHGAADGLVFVPMSWLASGTVGKPGIGRYQKSLDQ